MCGRFERSAATRTIIRDFRINRAAIGMNPSYNISPSQEVLIVRMNESRERQLDACRWGFLPRGADAGPLMQRMINARAETAASRPMFRDAFRRHRCLVIANGFYEWRTERRARVPYYIRPKSGGTFGFAGIYSPGGAEERCSCAILTTEANAVVREIHDRMPVIIDGGDEDTWLDPAVQDPGVLMKLIRPYPSELIEMYKVTRLVNSPAYDSADAVMPVARGRNGDPDD